MSTPVSSHFSCALSHHIPTLSPPPKQDISSRTVRLCRIQLQLERALGGKPCPAILRDRQRHILLASTAALSSSSPSSSSASSSSSTPFNAAPTTFWMPMGVGGVALPSRHVAPFWRRAFIAHRPNYFDGDSALATGQVFESLSSPSLFFCYAIAYRGY